MAGTGSWEASGAVLTVVPGLTQSYESALGMNKRFLEYKL